MDIKTFLQVLTPEIIDKVGPATDPYFNQDTGAPMCLIGNAAHYRGYTGERTDPHWVIIERHIVSQFALNRVDQRLAMSNWQNALNDGLSNRAAFAKVIDSFSYPESLSTRELVTV